MANLGRHRHRHEAEMRGEVERVPRPTTHFRRRAWLDFQRALDPLAPPKPIRTPRQH